VIAIQPAVILVFTDMEVAVSATEHVLLLGDRSLHVCATGQICIRHVENGETHSVRDGQLPGDLSPVPREHFDAEL
jgi:hypothetical protein